MTRTHVAAAAAFVAMLLAAAAALGQTGTLESAGTSAAAADTQATDARALATMYRKTVDCYRGLAAGYIFQTHVGIGMVAELAANKVYGTDMAVANLERITGGMAAMQQLLGTLADVQLPDVDRQLVNSIQKLTVDVAAQAKALSKYLLSNNQKDAETYHKLRSDTGASINKFLGIN